MAKTTETTKTKQTKKKANNTLALSELMTLINVNDKLLEMYKNLEISNEQTPFAQDFRNKRIDYTSKKQTLVNILEKVYNNEFNKLREG